MKTTILLLTLLLQLSTVAQETLPSLKLTDGKTYEGVTITRVDADGLRIKHTSGTAKIPFEKLPDDLQKKYNYDPAKAAEFRKVVAAVDAQQDAADHALVRETAAKKEAALKLKAACLIYSYTDQVRGNELLVRCSDSAYVRGGLNPDNRQMITHGQILITKYPDVSKIATDDKVNCLAWPTGKTRQIGRLTVHEYEYVSPVK